ncbi:MAG: hypothetical protein Roseis2KO_59530 [Roseivirga sp.]
MFQFYFNDCIPLVVDNEICQRYFQKTLVEFNKLKIQFKEQIDSIITEKGLSDILVSNENLRLSDAILSIEDKNLKNFAFSIFYKYPIEDHFQDIDIDDLLEKDYILEVSGQSYSAINLAIVSKNGGYLFSLAFNEDISNNTLDITSKPGEVISINNLYGEPENTQFIADSLQSVLLSSSSNFDKLLDLVGENSYSNRFINSFKRLPKVIQDAVLSHFTQAVKRDGTTPFYPDGDLIKNVSPEGSKYGVFELRIFKPTAYRLYFFEKGGITFLAMIEKKPPEKKQRAHINSAKSIINSLIQFYD